MTYKRWGDNAQDGQVKIYDSSKPFGFRYTSTSNLLSLNVANGTETLGDTTGYVFNNASGATGATGRMGAKHLAVTSSAANSYVGMGTASVTTQPSNGLIAVNAGDVHTFLVWAKSATITSNITVSIYWFQSDKTTAASTASISSVAAALSTSWTAYQVVGNAPSNAEYAAVMVHVATTTSNQAFQLDTISFHAGTGGRWADAGNQIHDIGTIYANGVPTSIQVAPIGAKYIDLSTGSLWLKASGSDQNGWVVGTTGSVPTTDNAAARYDGTAGKLQNSGVIIDDSNNVSGIGTLTSGEVETEFIDFNIAAPFYTPAAGELTWNDGEGTLDLGLAGGNVTLSIGQEQVVRVYNGTGQTLTDGQAVYIVGAQGQRPDVALAQANSEAKSDSVLAVVTEPITAGAEGFATTFGVVRGLDTSSWAEGSALWLSPSTPGGLTTTKPTAPNHVVLVGYCVRQHASSGQVFIRIQNGFELDELHDVLISNKQGNDVLAYDSVNGYWKNVNAVNLSGNSTFNNVSITGTLDLQQAQLKTDLKSITATTPLLIDSFTSASYRGAEYTLQLSQGTNYFMTKLILIHNGTDVAITEYGTTALGSDIPYVFSTDFSLGNMELMITCSNADITPVSLKLYRTLYDS